MAHAAAQGIWCVTCGSYIRPGSHGIHEPRYGHGPRDDSPRAQIGGPGAVALVVATISGAAFVLLLVAIFAWRLAI